ncbi:multicopper oxidase domain-containing protein [Rhizomonospora bruguierae]|uniref:multicopper oxidase domain-containing protein n=1 Tax=Rhizomonospora bruguierae TaxID=1581705 RepID=UPI001BCFD118|nr:multicopper oxidase domain-containing protein [Micromonospora sp. NBRC 107566]
MPDSPEPPPPGPAGRGGIAAWFGSLFPMLTGGVALGLLVGFALIGFAPGSGLTMAASGQTSAAGAAAPGAGKKLSFDIELGDMYVKPPSISVPRGADVTVNVFNKGNQQHTLALEGADTPLLDPGESATWHWGVISRSTQAWCLVAGHKDAGMLLPITIEGEPAQAVAARGAADGTGSNDTTIDASAKPAADWKPVDPTLQPAEGGTTHDVTLRVQEKILEVAPGVKQVRWTYNGTAPGPVLHGRVGDVFTIHLVNDGTMEHSIDFHASKVAPNVEMRTIKPGESLDYQFKAQFAGIFTYHCGADPMIYHMGNGMYGAVVVDPPKLAKVDKEIVLVQSELHLGPQGQPGDLKKMLAGDQDAVVFNGYYNQYALAPIKVAPGSRVRVWLDNAGPNENMAFHVVGTIFDTVWKEGAYRLRPGNAEQGGSQTLDLQPTQGGFVEFTLPDAGSYPFITHKMMNMSHGALGIFEVGGTR